MKAIALLLTLIAAGTISAQLVISPENLVPTRLRPAAGQAGLVLEFPTRQGDLYTVLSGDSPDSTDVLQTVQANGETIAIPAIAFAPDNTLPAAVEVTLTVIPISNGGLLLDWTSLDGTGRRTYTLRNGSLHPNIPPNYRQTFQSYQFTLLTRGSIAAAPGNSPLGPLDTLMISQLENALLVFNADAAVPPLTPPSDPTLLAADSKRFFRVRRASGSSLDWDGDGVSNESESLSGTNLFQADTDFDGYSDQQEMLAPDRNPSVNERLVEVDAPPPGIGSGLLARYDFETTTNVGGSQAFPNRVSNLHPLLSPVPGTDDGTASRSVRIQGNPAQAPLIANSNLLTSNSFSISFAFRLDLNSLNNLQGSLSAGLLGYYNAFRQRIFTVDALRNAGNDVIRLGIGNQFGTSIPSSNLDDGQWHTLTLVKDSTYRLFIDGDLELTFTNAPAQLPQGSLLVGAWGQVIQSQTFGRIDRLTVHSRALTSGDILTLTNDTKDDADLDGIKDSQEQVIGTNPFVADPPGAAAP